MKNNNCNNKIDTYTSFNNINSNYWYNNNETTTLIRTIQNWENEKQLDYNVVIVSISSCYPVIQSWLCLCLCMCILLIITLRLLGQSVTSPYCPICDSNRSSSNNKLLRVVYFMCYVYIYSIVPPLPQHKREEERHQQQQQQNVLWYHLRLF